MKIGLLFGTFNPIHNGHLVIAGYFSEFTDLDEVWIVVSPHNPLKSSPSLLQDLYRLQLVRLAVGINKKIKVSDVEFTLQRPSYTINTLVHLKAKFPKHNFTLIIGEDNLENFDKWKDYKKILDDFKVYTYPRPHSSKTKFHRHSKVKLFKDVPLMDISATFIRRAIAEGKDVRYIMPPAVWEYITKNKFYK
jgi:nicotinate-nucleotide adenylyltransferase